jgi:amino acid transporter
MTFNLFGNPLANAAAHSERLKKIFALPILSSDALSSVAYGTEEILRVLMLAGIAAMALSVHIAFVICLLLIVLGASYYQTIKAYPNGGGAFSVAKDNLGPIAGVLAGTALMIDYVLTVSVSVAAGVLAITSAVPFLMPYTVLLCVLAILLMAFMSLRGVRESARVFAYPAYIFILLVFLLLAMGAWKIHTHLVFTQAFVHHQQNAFLSTNVAATLTVYLILSAFSQGCSALSGIECIANAVPIFKKPEIRNARQTLLMMVFLLGAMFFGITYLANTLHIIPNDNESVLSQLGHFVFARGFFYYLLQGATAAILLLAANTAFNGFPRLASVLSQAGYLPKQFSSPGDRLSFSNGIIFLAGASAVLIMLFQGNVNSLIPLYSVGVYLAFSLSQLGMVRFWYKKRLGVSRWHWKAAINACGCMATFTALALIILSKFFSGAWITVALLVVFPMIFFAVYRHYQQLDKELAVTINEANDYLLKMSKLKPKVIVPVSRIYKGTLAALEFAQHVSDDVIAVVVDVKPANTEKLRCLWMQLAINVPLVVLPSPYREVIGPLKRFILKEDHREPERGLCMVVMPEAITARWWQFFLHNQYAAVLKASMLLSQSANVFSPRVFVSVPYKLH